MERRNAPQSARQYTSKQMGDACEMLIAAEMTLAGVPALKVPDNWPDYDVIAHPHNRPLQKISVKSRTYKTGSAYFTYNREDDFDWLAFVILQNDQHTERGIYIVPKAIADKQARKNGPGTKSEHKSYFSIIEVPELFKAYQNNFSLSDIQFDNRFTRVKRKRRA